MAPRYFDLDDILCEQQRVPCVFNMDVPGLGTLEDRGEKDIRRGTRLDLPLWIVEPFVRNMEDITFEWPYAFQGEARNALRASATAVSLRTLSPYYYALAQRLLFLCADDAFVDLLSDTLLKRATEIVDMASNPQSVLFDGREFSQGLEEFEVVLFKLAHESQKASKKWVEKAGR